MTEVWTNEADLLSGQPKTKIAGMSIECSCCGWEGKITGCECEPDFIDLPCPKCGRALQMASEQPSQSAMIFEQVNGSIKVALELLEKLEVKGTNEDAQKQGCIWTLKGWRDNNLKHLQKVFE